MNHRHFLTLFGFIFFVIFIIAKNGILINDKISFILSSDYVFFMSVFFIFMGYYLSTTGKKDKDSISGDPAPGSSGKSRHSDGVDFDGGGGGD